ncbi:Alpha/beta hydrolase family protein [compost metagenome]
MGVFARYYRDKLGYNVLMPDARGHGSSEGQYIGYGWHDRLDLLRWIDLAAKKTGDDPTIVLHGVSMGGATVTMASGEKLPPAVKALVSDCAFTSVEEVLTYHLDRMYHLPPFPLMPSVSLMTKLRAGYGFDEASAIAQVRKADRPMLFIHGASDSFVPVAMGHRLYAACPTEKDLLLVPNAEHGTSIALDPVGYERKVGAFLAKYAR